MSVRKRAILLNDTSGENHVGCSLVIGNLRRICKDRGVDIIRSYTRKDLLGQTKIAFMSPEKYDFVIVNGEGTLHHSPQVAKLLLNFHSGDKPQILVNTVWEKMFCFSALLNKFKFVSTRESRSHAEMCKFRPAEKIHLVPDLIFYNPANLLTRDPIGYGDSVMVSICDTLERQKNFFPIQKRPMNNPGVGAYVSWMKSLDLFVTGRFHGVCLAILLGVPFLAIPSNSHKIEGLLEDCGCPELLIGDISEVGGKRKLASQALGKTRAYAEEASAKISKFYDKVLSSI